MTRKQEAKPRFNEVQILLAEHLGELGLSRAHDRATFPLNPNYFGLEYFFHHLRDWRFDAAICLGSDAPWVRKYIAIEAEGLVYGGRGGHQTVKGFTANCEKYNEAILQGWILLRFPVSQIRDGSWLETLKRAIGAKQS